ncbi:MAG TPA: EAL domain-containing protein [Gemmatimonadaceae bacterium]|jgi:diguanylate cyclase (GGDEF)-like protein|nr:EAL domain-containing protein [Gemmatimonadaceae bacterium]
MPLPTFLTVASLFVQSGAALLIACVFFGLHRRYWRPFLQHWTWSWLALAAYSACSGAARIVGLTRGIDDPFSMVLAALSGVSGYLQITWLVLGTWELATGAPFQRRTSRWLIVCAAVGGALLVLAFAWNPANGELVYQLRVPTRRVAVALASLFAARAISRAPKIARAIGRRSVMLAFFGLAAHQAHFLAVSGSPEMRMLHPLYVATLGLVDVVIYFGLAMGLVIWLLEEERQATMDAAAKIEQIAYHDSLTGLPNRQLFLNQMGMAVHRARRTNGVLAVLFLDLDRFKIVNDSLGHAAGDLLLQTVAERIRSAVRGEDSVTRLGGDEFAVLCTEINSPDDAVFVAERIIAAVKRPIFLERQEVFVTTSLGISLYPADGSEPEALLKNADAAMYRAKAQGRDLVERYVPELGAAALAQLGLESHLKRALEHEQLLLNYQPIVDSRTGRINGLEALIRWNHPERGLIMPSEFIGLAEATGAIVPMGEWVLREACRQIQCWRERGQPQLRAAVNLSVRQLQHADLVSRVQQILEETGLPPDRLEIEITESIAMRSSGRAIDNLRLLKDHGVRVSIDDLGTGYSSLSALRLFPMDSLKIDRSFVNGVPHNTDDSAIAAAVIALGQTLGVNVIAEGIERPEQLAFFAAHRCAEWQGFLLVSPVTAEECEQLLFAGTPALGMHAVTAELTAG